ncbi:MAG: ABC transporter permease subunit, partial [Rudanella sp.]|nr:ABC transporter permease subunit [Rudanella sp.]
AGVLQTVPSLALLGVLIPVLGIGVGPALVALFLYALLPIVRNTFVGIQGVSPAVVEAARGIGFTDRQVLWRVELPLALPVLFAGVRTAAVINVGVATLAAYVAAGGLGEFIFGGIALSNTPMMLAGAMPAAGLAVAFDAGLAWLQRRAEGPLLQGKRGRVVLVALVAVPLLTVMVALTPGRQDKLVAGFAHEFYGRADGFPGLQKTYGLQLKPRLIDQNLMYEAIHRNQVDIISGYSTDGRVRAFDLVVLHDDKQAFPPYYAAPVVRQATLDRYPELGPVMNRLAGKLTDSVMTALNYRVDFRHELPQTVARDFLKQQGLLRAPSAQTSGAVVRMGSKVFSEQYILAEVYKQLIEGFTNLTVESRTGLGGTQICFDALRTGAIDFYPEYTGTGLLVILQPSPTEMARLSMQPDSVYAYVQDRFQRQYGLRWLPPLGFNNSYCLMMRRPQAEKLGIKSISGLVGYLGQ